LYYLQTRYYNPEWGRFLNADCLFVAGDALTGSNMFAYCGNNPVMGRDPSGMRSDPTLHFGKDDIIYNALLRTGIEIRATYMKVDGRTNPNNYTSTHLTILRKAQLGITPIAIDVEFAGVFCRVYSGSSWNVWVVGINDMALAFVDFRNDVTLASFLKLILDQDFQGWVHAAEIMLFRLGANNESGLYLDPSIYPPGLARDFNDVMRYNEMLRETGEILFLGFDMVRSKNAFPKAAAEIFSRLRGMPFVLY